MVNTKFWSGRRVLVTGNTGFKGGWLSLWLHRLGAQLWGYALPAPTNPSLFGAARIGDCVETTYADVRDLIKLTETIQQAKPEVVFHLAAQALVRPSYRDPVNTYASNVMGTVHLLEAVRACASVRAVIIVTSDKCYENREWIWGYREDEPMGGRDPYSSSKGCAELVTAAYRSSFFHPRRYQEHGVALASARAGNVIGGGDWAEDRLIPDFVRATIAGQDMVVRFPGAVRPWQHVLEPAAGYIRLAERLVTDGLAYSEGWNFGPRDQDARSVSWMVQNLVGMWGENARWRVAEDLQLHEAHYLKLDTSKARERLDWEPRWSLKESLGKVVEWYRAHRDGRDMREICLEQIEAYEQTGVRYWND